MAKKKKVFRAVQGDAGYRLALNEIERCFNREPKPDTPASDLLDRLVTVIEADVREHRLAKVRGARPRKRNGYSSFSVVK
ncbi:MAG TPA: hypothetical protein VKG24_32305 [Pseudolabrys sp.]|jgi:antitoxin component HigA of HigAB toxin-antitoxin module|nr:hypothetical protein [Pseudolabrys sp.]